MLFHCKLPPVDLSEWFQLYVQMVWNNFLKQREKFKNINSNNKNMNTDVLIASARGKDLPSVPDLLYFLWRKYITTARTARTTADIIAANIHGCKQPLEPEMDRKKKKDICLCLQRIKNRNSSYGKAIIWKLISYFKKKQKIIYLFFIFWNWHSFIVHNTT